MTSFKFLITALFILMTVAFTGTVHAQTIEEFEVEITNSSELVIFSGYPHTTSRSNYAFGVDGPVTISLLKGEAGKIYLNARYSGGKVQVKYGNRYWDLPASIPVNNLSEPKMTFKILGVGRNGSVEQSFYFPLIINWVDPPATDQDVVFRTDIIRANDLLVKFMGAREPGSVDFSAVNLIAIKEHILSQVEPVETYFWKKGGGISGTIVFTLSEDSCVAKISSVGEKAQLTFYQISSQPKFEFWQNFVTVGVSDKFGINANARIKGFGDFALSTGDSVNELSWLKGFNWSGQRFIISSSFSRLQDAGRHLFERGSVTAMVDGSLNFLHDSTRSMIKGLRFHAGLSKQMIIGREDALQNVPDPISFKLGLTWRHQASLTVKRTCEEIGFAFSTNFLGTLGDHHYRQVLGLPFVADGQEVFLFSVRTFRTLSDERRFFEFDDEGNFFNVRVAFLDHGKGFSASSTRFAKRGNELNLAGHFKWTGLHENFSWSPYVNAKFADGAYGGNSQEFGFAGSFAW